MELREVSMWSTQVVWLGALELAKLELPVAQVLAHYLGCEFGQPCSGLKVPRS